jgi:hypothetical protein
VRLMCTVVRGATENPCSLGALQLHESWRWGDSEGPRTSLSLGPIRASSKCVCSEPFSAPGSRSMLSFSVDYSEWGVLPLFHCNRVRQRP